MLLDSSEEMRRLANQLSAMSEKTSNTYGRPELFDATLALRRYAMLLEADAQKQRNTQAQVEQREEALVAAGRVANDRQIKTTDAYAIIAAYELAVERAREEAARG